jgi:hypothetical protein
MTVSPSHDLPLAQHMSARSAGERFADRSRELRHFAAASLSGAGIDQRCSEVGAADLYAQGASDARRPRHRAAGNTEAVAALEPLDGVADRRSVWAGRTAQALICA